MGYLLKILSPVHIGCGEQYTGLNFILDGSKMFVVEPETLTLLLDTQNRLKFAEWLEANSNQIAEIDDRHREEKRKDRRSEITKKLSRELQAKKQGFTLKNLVEAKKMVTLEQLKKNALYSIDCQSGIYNDSEIYPFVKQMRQPYIPGTEIKGAIRTAILYCAFQDNAVIQEWLRQSVVKMLKESAEKRQEVTIATYKDYIDSVKNQKKPNSHKKFRLDERIKKITSALQNQILNSNPDKPDAKYDAMKFMQVGDSDLIDVEKMQVSYVEPFNISTRFKSYYEFLMPDTNISLTAFTLEGEKSRNQKLDKMEFKDSHKQLLSSMSVILSKCHRFSADLLKEEIAYFSHHGKPGIVEHLRKIAQQNTPESPVLRIGKDEGYTSLTVGLAIKRLMPDLYENVLIHTTKNKSYDSSITKDAFYFPKSRKIVYWNGKELTAGWVKLIPDAFANVQQTNNKKKSAKQQTPAVSLDPALLQALQAHFGGKTSKT